MPLWQLAWSSSHSSDGALDGTSVVGGGVGAVRRRETAELIVKPEVLELQLNVHILNHLYF